MAVRGRLLRVLLLLPAVTVMAERVHEPLYGSHLFRQAHTAANIDKFVEKGLSLHPGTYNVDAPFSLYDFPAYQLLVAAVSRVARTDPLSTARTVSIAVFGLTLWVLGRLLERTGVPALQATLALAFFAYAPLTLFYFQAPMVDGPALFLSYLSLYAFVRWDLGHRHARAWLALSILSGLLSTLIKNPVYLPALLALLWFRLRRRGWRSLWRPGVAALVLSVGAAVILFKAYADAVNDSPALLAGWEIEQYFGPVAERLDPDAWAPIMATLGTLTLHPLLLAAGVAGAIVHLRRRDGGHRSLPTGMLIGPVVTLLVFFNRYRYHNYYALPLVLPLAYFAARAVRRLTALGRALGRARGWPSRAAARGLVGLAVVATVAWPRSGLQQLSTSPHWMAARGEWIHGLTGRDDFVVYVLEGHEGKWNPAYLYFAQRDGCNIAATQLERRTLAHIRERFAASYRRFLVFCADADAAAALRQLGARPVAEGKARHLYEIDPRERSHL